MYLVLEDMKNLCDNGDPGYCTECDDVTCENGVEPDADGYVCPACGHRTVQGLMNAIIAGHVRVESVMDAYYPVL